MTGIIDLAGGGYHNLKVKKKKMKNARSTQMRISSLLATLGQSQESESLYKSKKNVTCQPCNPDLFAERVESFNVATWFNKPNELSALQCARYGWKNTKEDTIICVTCRVTYNCRLEQNLSPAS
eukprot:gene10469-2599_t